MFHGSPRHDSVIYHKGDKMIFCELIYAFTYNFRGTLCALALVQPLDAPLQITGSRRIVDRDMGLCRVKERRREDAIIVPLRSVRRGALLVTDASRPQERLVVDALDGDMFLRCVDIFPDRDMAAQIRLRL